MSPGPFLFTFLASNPVLDGARMTSKLVAIADSANTDGSHDVTIDHSGERIAVNIPLQHVQELIAKFQARIFEKQMQIPQLAVNRIEIAGKEANCELMVSTVQTGPVVLAMSDADLLHMKKDNFIPLLSLLRPLVWSKKAWARE
jgi:hypothetical protein